MSPPFTTCNTLLMVVTAVVSYLAWRHPALEEDYIFEPRSILAWKQYYRLLTSAFLHAGWWHLGLNLLGLYMFGWLVEFRLGPAYYLLLYFGSIVGGNLLSLFVHRHHEYRAYGASGGVSGIIFAQILLYPGTSLYQFPLPFAVPGWLYAILFMAASFFGMKANNKGDVGHDAHLGGAIVGALIAAALEPAVVRANWKLFCIVLSAAILLLLYLWRNPLFLPLTAFRTARVAKRRRERLPPHKAEALELDSILEKISRTGMESLSEAEREILHQASGKYQRRTDSKKPESGLAI